MWKKLLMLCTTWQHLLRNQLHLHKYVSYMPFMTMLLSVVVVVQKHSHFHVNGCYYYILYYMDTSQSIQHSQNVCWLQRHIFCIRNEETPSKYVSYYVAKEGTRGGLFQLAQMGFGPLEDYNMVRVHSVLLQQHMYRYSWWYSWVITVTHGVYVSTLAQKTFCKHAFKLHTRYHVLSSIFKGDRMITH